MKLSTMVKPRSILVAYLLAPLPLVTGLALMSGTSFVNSASSPIIDIFAYASFVLLLVANLKSKGLGLKAEGNSSLGGPTIAGAVILFLFGSYYGLGLVHWVAILLLYNAVVLYLGGFELLGISMLPSMALLPIAFPSIPELQIITLVAMTGANIGSLIVLNKREATQTEAECQEIEHDGRGEQSHCLYCGRQIRMISTHLNYARVARIAIVSAILLILSAVPVQAVSIQGGVPYVSTYSILGMTSSNPIVSTNGWKASWVHTSVTGGIGETSMNLTNGNQKIRVDVAFSQAYRFFAFSNSKASAVRAVLTSYPNVTRIGFVSFSGGPSAQLMARGTNSTFTGLYWDLTVSAVNGTTVAPITVSYFAAEDIQPSSINGSGLYAVTRSSLANIQGIQAWAMFVTYLAEAWASVDSYVTIVGAVLIIALPFEAARRSDTRGIRSMENVDALLPRELEALALISSRTSPWTGREIMEKMALERSFTDRQQFEGLMHKLEELGLVDRVVRRDSKGSIMMWRSRVG